MFNNQAQSEQQQFRCPGCGRTSDTNIFIPNGAGIAACPSCGLTAEEGQRKLNDELTAMFNRGMRLGSGDVPAPIITSATITALGGGGGGGSTTSGGLLSAGPTTTAAPCGLGYNSSQHYHHSMHVSALTTDGPVPRPNSAPGFVEGNAASSAAAAGAGDGAARDDMDMEGSGAMQHEPDPEPEPYMKSGYEYLVERDYNRQAHAREQGERVQAVDPAFSSKEWWRDFHHPIEFQYGVYQQMRDRENEAPQEDEQMRLW